MVESGLMNAPFVLLYLMAAMIQVQLSAIMSTTISKTGCPAALLLPMVVPRTLAVQLQPGHKRNPIADCPWRPVWLYPFGRSICIARQFKVKMED